MKELVTEFFGNYTLQDLLGAAQAFRLAAARLKEEGGTSQSALDKLVGMRDGSDCLGAPRPPPSLTPPGSQHMHTRRASADAARHAGNNMLLWGQQL